MKTALPVRPPLPVLPQEVILHVTKHLEDATFSEIPFDPQRSLWATCLLSRNWYGASIQALYRRPRLTSKNYDHFVETVCPSINTHVKKTDLAGMVKVLDLSQLVFAGSKSFIARLLRRFKDNLEILNAPQTSFAVNSLAALSKCTHLRILDLSLVTEQIPILDFFRAIEKLDTLVTLHLPRASLSSPKTGPGTRASAWPRNLAHLILPGRISRILSVHAPEKQLEIESLHLQEVPLDYWDLSFLNRVSPGLRRLTIREPVSRSTRFEQGVWDAMLDHFAGLKSLRLEYFSSLYHLMSTVEEAEEDARPAALDSLEELSIGPVLAGAELLRSSNRPFDIADLAESEEPTVLEFVEKLPNLRRLILLLQDLPVRILGDLYEEYHAHSALLQEYEESKADDDSSDQDNGSSRQPAGVFWTLDGPAIDLTNPENATPTLFPIGASVTM